MSLDKLISIVFNELIEEYELSISSYERKGVCPKSGSDIEEVVIRCSFFELMFYRNDGEVNSKIRVDSNSSWEYVRAFRGEHKTIEELLDTIPGSPLGDEELLAKLKPDVLNAIKCIKN